MKNPENSLFGLIKSLDRFEKGHFRKYTLQTSTKKNSVYLKLFDAINRQVQSGKDYNESEIKQQLIDEKYAKHFPVLKNYLYNLILKSMRYYNVKSINLKLDELIYDINFLLKKSQHRDCVRIISKAKQTAEENDMYGKLLEIINKEKFLITSTGIRHKNKTETDLHNEETSALRKLENIIDYEKLSDKIINLTQEIGVVRNSEDALKFKKIINSPLLKSESLALTYSAKQNYHFTLTAYYFSISDYKNAYTSVKDLINFLEKYPSKLKANSINYISNLQNLVFLSMELDKFDEAELYLKKLKQKFQVLRKHMHFYTQKVLNTRSIHIEISLYNARNEFQKSIKLIELVQNELINNEIKADIKLPLYFVIAVSYFQAAKYENALEWINKTLNDKDIEALPDIYSSARILSLIIHFELGNTELIEYSVKSFYKYLLRRKALYGFEKIALKFIKKIPRISNYEDLYEALLSVKKGFEKISDNTYEKTIMEYFDFISWIDMKINSIKQNPKKKITR